MKSVWIIFSLLFSFSLYAVKLKVGVLAPEGTNWAKNMKKMAKEIKKATNKKVKIKFYFGGAQGDEDVVLRKIRVNQLHGGIFTGKTLGDINGNVRVVEIPFVFGSNREKAWKTVEELAPFFNKGFDKAEFHNLGFFEIGMVYFVSQKKTPKLDALKGLKIWSWEGDEIVSTMIKSMGLISVPLPLPDVLSSLSTGVIQAAYAPPMGMVALQWNTKIKYLVDFPIAYSVGAFLISNKGWKKISPEHQKIVSNLAETYLKKVSEDNIKDNIAALSAVKSTGVEFLKFPAADEDKARLLRKTISKELKGKLFTEEALKKLESKL